MTMHIYFHIVERGKECEKHKPWWFPGPVIMRRNTTRNWFVYMITLKILGEYYKLCTNYKSPFMFC
jgi:hypothetical protein